MQKLLILTDWYQPAYKAGGPVTSIINLQAELSGDFSIYILTSDRDLGDTVPFEGINTDNWTKTGEHTSVYYLSKQNRQYKVIRQIISDLSPDVMYLNSMYSKHFALMPLLYKLSSAPQLKTVLCPRGMLRESAISNKPYKKKLFLLLMRMNKVGTKIKFHATDEQESRDIRKWFGEEAEITQISNIPATAFFTKTDKTPGTLRILFAGRIHPIKNLHFALQILQKLSCNIHFRIAGNTEDKAYLQKCEQVIKQLPENISVEILGAMPHEKFQEEYRNCHLMFLPTTGENFGHSIFEALSSGRPVLISDQTPWRKLAAKGAGADLPLNNLEAYEAFLSKFCEMDQSSFDQSCQNAYNYAREFLKQQNFKEKYYKMLAK